MLTAVTGIKWGLKGKDGLLICWQSGRILSCVTRGEIMPGIRS